MNTSALLDKLIAHQNLSEAEAGALLYLLAGADEASGTRHQAPERSPLHPALAGALLTALRAKGETPEEIRGFANAMRQLATPPSFTIPSQACDLVGTGGDGAHTYNLSTGAAILAAAAGVPIVKHGNRSVSSRSGAADLLEALGMPIPTPEAEQQRTLQTARFCFLFAPAHHPAAANIAPIRKALAVRTVFNILGPLTNPAQPPFAVIGAFSEPVAELMAHALSGMNIRRAFVVHGEPGWDEATPVGPFTLFTVKPNRVERTTRDPITLGLERCQPKDLKGADAQHNAQALRRVFDGEQGPHRDALCLAAALAIEVTGLESTPSAALHRAQRAIDDGKAKRTLEGITTPPQQANNNTNA